MKRAIPIVLVLVLLGLPGCEFVKVEKGSVQPVLRVEKEAVVVAKEAVHIEPGTVSPEAVKIDVGKGIEINVPKNAVHVEPINIRPVLSVAKGAVEMSPVINVQPESVKIVIPPEAIKLNLTIAEGAFKPQLSVKLEPNAITIRGAELEKGAISTSPWIIGLLLVLTTVFGLAYIITKARRHAESSKIPNREKSLLDGPF